MTTAEIIEKLDSFILPDTRVLIFDLDGTLVDTNQAHLAAWQEACQTFGMTYPVEKFFYYAGLPSTRIAEEVIKIHPNVVDVRAEEVSDAKEIAFDKYQHNIKPIVPVLGVLKNYHHKLGTGLGTGRIRASTMKTLHTLKISHLFDVIITADDVNAYKPAPDTFLKCAEVLDSPPDCCLVFEDAERGLTAATRAGMRVVNVRDYIGPDRL